MKKIYFALLILLIVPFAFVNAQVWSEINKSLPHNFSDNSGNLYGKSIAIDGDFAVVGAPGYYNSTGYVFVLHFNGTTWDKIATLSASDKQSLSNFGVAVDISSDVIIVGSYYQEKYGGNPGVVYVFEKQPSGWIDMTETAKLFTASGNAVEAFGTAVSIFSDNIVVGAPNNDENGKGSGASYIFSKPTSGWATDTETVKIIPSDNAEGDNFGCSVSISGSNIVIGAYHDNDNGEDSGSAYIFTEPSTGWADATTEVAKLTSSDGSINDYFGYSVDISKGDIVIGAYRDNDYSGSAYVFSKPSLGWSTTTENAKLTAFNSIGQDLFGYSVSISEDKILIGANGDDGNSGTSYIFKKPSTGWVTDTENTKLTSSDRENDDFFGYSVDISNGKLIVGAYNESGDNAGSVYYFEETSLALANESQKLIPTYLNFANAELGESVAIDGNYAVIGMVGNNEETGRAVVMEYNSGTWNKIAILTPSIKESTDNFGNAVDIDGNTIVVGSSTAQNGRGSAFVFVKPSNGWSDMVETARLTSTDRATNDNFGYSIAVSGDDVVVGAINDDDNGSNSGSAYVFSKPSSGWTHMTETAKLKDSNGQNDDLFGYSVAIYNNNIVVGAILGDGNGTDDGTVSVFEKPISGWTNTNETAKLIGSDSNLWFSFGCSVSILDNNIVVGASNANSKGAVYIFNKTTTSWISSNETAILTSSDLTSRDGFGKDVDINNDKIIIGSYKDDDNGTSSGSAYIFNKPTSGWITTNKENAKLIASDGAENDMFGHSVSISNNKLIIGAYHDSTDELNSGSTYFYSNLDRQTITFNSLPTKTYGDSNFTVSATGGDSGNPVIFTSSDNNIATCTGTNGSEITIIGAGSCNIMANQSGNDFYLPANEVSQILTIDAKKATLIVDSNQNKIYNESDPIFTYTHNGLLNDDDFTGELSRATGEDVGAYSITIGSISAGNNYIIEFIESDFIINKATPVLSWRAIDDIEHGTEVNNPRGKPTRHLFYFSK